MLDYAVCELCIDGDCENCNLHEFNESDIVIVCANCNDSQEGCDYCRPERCHDIPADGGMESLITKLVNLKN